MAKQNHRIDKRATDQYPPVGVQSETVPGARGKEPNLIKRCNDIATLNAKTIVEKTKRESIETWMKDKNILTMGFKKQK